MWVESLPGAGGEASRQSEHSSRIRRLPDATWMRHASPHGTAIQSPRSSMGFPAVA